MLLNRKGFVKVAVEQGLDGGIIPVYHYGNTQVCWLCAPGLPPPREWRQAAPVSAAALVHVCM